MMWSSRKLLSKPQRVISYLRSHNFFILKPEICGWFPFLLFERRILHWIWVVVAFLPPRRTPSSKGLGSFLRSRNITRSKQFSAIKDRCVFHLIDRVQFSLGCFSINAFMKPPTVQLIFFLFSWQNVLLHK